MSRPKFLAKSSFKRDGSAIIGSNWEILIAWLKLGLGIYIVPVSVSNIQAHVWI